MADKLVDSLGQNCVRPVFKKAQDVVIAACRGWARKHLLDKPDPFDESRNIMFLIIFLGHEYNRFWP